MGEEQKSGAWELVLGGVVKNGVLVGGDVKGSFATREEAEAEGAKMRRNADQSIRARLVGDSPEKLAERRIAAQNPTAVAPRPVTTAIGVPVPLVETNDAKKTSK